MSEHWTVDGHKVIEVGGAAGATDGGPDGGPESGHEQPVRRVRVRLIGGRVDVVAHDEPQARLEVHDVRGRPLEVTWDGETLEVAHPDAGWESLLSGLVDKVRSTASNGWAGWSSGRSSKNDTAEVSLAVPRGADVEIGTVTAEGLAVALTGKVEVRTVTGSVRLDDLSGPVVARTVSGEIEARGQAGEMTMDSVSGSFTVQTRGAERLTAKTVSGSLSVDALKPDLEVTFGSVSGGLVVRRPQGNGYDAELRSLSGRVVIGETRITGEYGTIKHSHHEPHAAVRVSAKTVSGDITLLDPAAPTAPAASA